ncbi:ABC transporter, solute-binding protein [Paenibacillus sp. oral taxon 786 str. D14]|uniref:ABC transporter substrate-binding protein n=1 Tax=Paenibacillus sp. oral taxon 786 TaxID=652715 RepID=UPI0001AFD477|nr:extracellular solute-binding protein [Paenibacillus sp. oral taxon 786]EES72371.1 ABC transporter, solute-binding protein [Paenibacillus sp. oral taxon 786 str. D14]
MQFNGMTWSHERGLNPLVAASRVFQEREPGVQIRWDARSLSDFELYPLELLVDQYDFLMIDHPHIGTAVAKGLLLPLDELIEEEFLLDQARHSTGLSYASYTFNGKQWALPVDAAAQFSAYRKDLIDSNKMFVPSNWNEVLELAKQMPAGLTIGMPLVPVHAYSSFFTLCAQIAGRAYWSEALDLPIEIGEQALSIMKGLMPFLHPASVDCDPIGMLDLMGTKNEIVYIPLIYGYVNYAKEKFRSHVITFDNIPSDSGIPSGSMIGGVGLAISSRCRYKELAADFVKMVASPSFQRTTYFMNEGQPGHKTAWLDSEVNRLCGNFFKNTLDTMMHGSLRPRFDGYILFQEQAGHLIREVLINRSFDGKTVIRKLNEMHRVARAG